MKPGYLSQYFVSVVAKRLSAVEADTKSSNQHEFNGTKELKIMLGDAQGEKVSIPTLFMWAGGDDKIVSTEGFVTWYDARHNHPTRSEYRLYFPTTDVSILAKEGDLMFIAKRPNGSLMIIVSETASTTENQLLMLFGIDRPKGTLFELAEIENKGDLKVDFAARFILEQLGIEIEDPEPLALDLLLQKFKGVLPSTYEFSDFARQSLKIDPRDDPDNALLAWMEQEEKLFRRMERNLVSKRIEQGFIVNGDVDVDGFISYSLHVQNRRKARAGFALENHLEFIFKSFALKYSRTGITENKSKPDFLFPDIRLYHDSSFDKEQLTMLGAKTSCKDRWRQILSEAERIDKKHLLTLEPGISENQTREMQMSNLQLVLPKRLHITYTHEQRRWLLDLAGFISLVNEKQNKKKFYF